MSPEESLSFPFSFLARLRFPQLFVVLAVLFGVDLLIPDMVPFIDEAVLLTLTVMAGMIRRRAEAPEPLASSIQKPEEKNITPESD